MHKPKIGNFRLNNLDKPVVQLDVRDGTVKCRYVVHLEIDGIVYVVDRTDKLAMGLFIDAVGEGWDPERWKEEIHREIESLEQDLQKIGNLADELREKIECIQKSKDYLREDYLREDYLREDIDDRKEELEYLYLKNPERWREKKGYLQELEKEYYDLQELEYEYPDPQELEKEYDDISQKIESLEQDLREETEYLKKLKEEYSDLQELEYEYPEGLLEVSPWKSGKIRLSHGNTEEKIPVEEFKRRHKCKKNRRKLNIRKQ